METLETCTKEEWDITRQPMLCVTRPKVNATAFTVTKYGSITSDLPEIRCDPFTNPYVTHWTVDNYLVIQHRGILTPVSHGNFRFVLVDVLDGRYHIFSIQSGGLHTKAAPHTVD
jgi:hypothetical protein